MYKKVKNLHKSINMCIFAPDSLFVEPANESPLISLDRAVNLAKNS